MEVCGHKFGEVLLTIELDDGEIIKIKDFDNMSNVLSSISYKDNMFVVLDKQLINKDNIRRVTIL